ncbi:MAG: hypothetical protein NWS20_05010 [Rickettsiaceae bacterium]|nr:hypothetical protein [Rickettsiaceae bacterium]MDP5020509.1 hypothetical protein [Rickettsiaceae bacterium]MDP5083682.1 hypothetical protein [Rickettsiaceae bacterium]
MKNTNEGTSISINAAVHVGAIKIFPGAVITIPASNSISGPIDIIFGEDVMHLAENASLSNCTMEVVGDQLQITPLGELAE